MLIWMIPNSSPEQSCSNLCKQLRRRDLLEGVPKWEEIADILLQFKEGTEKRLAGICNQKKALLQQGDRIMIQMESLVWLEATIRGTPYQPLGPVLRVMVRWSLWRSPAVPRPPLDHFQPLLFWLQPQPPDFDYNPNIPNLNCLPNSLWHYNNGSSMDTHCLDLQTWPLMP